MLKKLTKHTGHTELQLEDYYWKKNLIFKSLRGKTTHPTKESCCVLLGLCVTPERTVINGGLGAVAVVSVGFTMCTDGVTVGCIPNMLPLRPSSGPAVEPRSPLVTPTLDTHPRWRSTTAFCFCLTDSIAVGSPRCIEKPITTGEIGVDEPVCTSGLCVCVGVRTSESSADGKSDVLTAD